MQVSKPRSETDSAISRSEANVTLGRCVASVAVMLLCLLGVLALWETLAWMFGQRLGAMALVMAIGAALALRIGGYPRQASRPRVALAGCALGILTGLWLIAVLPIGAMMGQLPWTAAINMGPDLAWTLTRLGSTPLDWTLTLVALALAAWLAR